MPATVLVAKGSVRLSKIAWARLAWGILPTRGRDKKSLKAALYSALMSFFIFQQFFLMLWREALRGSRPILSG